MSCLWPRGGSTSASSAPPSHVSDAQAVPWVEIGPASLHLRHEMLKMYWDGVRRELAHIIRTLKAWQSSEYADPLPDEEATHTHVHGYDTFVDQVSHTSRRFSQRYRAARELATPASPPSYAEALRDRGWDIYAQARSGIMKQEIRSCLDAQTDGSMRDQAAILRRRTRMLLQAAQFLDMDKVIEYRRPEDLIGVSFWKRPVNPQLQVVSYDETGMPIFGPHLCSDCRAPIRGSLFRSLRQETTMVCEGCYREKYYAQMSFTKVHKQNILDKALPTSQSQSICRCLTLQRRDEAGNPRALFPIDPGQEGDRHLNQDGKVGRPRCGLFDLPEMVAETKHATTRLRFDKKTTLGERHRECEIMEGQEKEEYVKKPWATPRPPRVPNPNAMAPEAAIGQFGTSYGFTTEAYDEVPSYLRPYTDAATYGNVHMALRFGPLVIENGVRHTLRGALITNRDPPSLQVLRGATGSIEHSLLVAGASDRLLYSQNRPRSAKRYKAMMKQVVGGAFCGFLDREAEEQMVDALIAESRKVIVEGISVAQMAALMDASVDRLLERIRPYLSSRVSACIGSIASRLADPSVSLRWDWKSNTCQTFCDGLIDRGLFGPLLSTPAAAETGGSPLYLMSFVCRPGAYVREEVQTKYDVPNGLTEEYLLKFRYGRHDESDIIDTLSDYWYDWGCFDGPLYPYQDLFPWDCTEAYGRYPVACGECNLAKHVWAFPFDSWSLVSLHLARSRYLYPRDAKPGAAAAAAADRKTTPSLLIHDVSPSDSAAGGVMTDRAWFRNRLGVLLGQDALLAGAVAMARSPQFREATLWLHSQPDATQDRVKLGGIHRAQPFSHHFERGAYHMYFIASWAHLTMNLRVREYEKLRAYRATRADVGSGAADGGGDDWGCGEEGGCGLYVGDGCSAEAGDTCGSGCVSSGGGDNGGGDNGGGDDGGDGGCGGCGGCGG